MIISLLEITVSLKLDLETSILGCKAKLIVGILTLLCSECMLSYFQLSLNLCYASFFFNHMFSCDIHKSLGQQSSYDSNVNLL